jgi:hypothetical protein
MIMKNTGEKEKMHNEMNRMIDNGEPIPILNPRTEQFEIPDHWLNGKYAVCYLIVDIQYKLSSIQSTRLWV